MSPGKRVHLGPRFPVLTKPTNLVASPGVTTPLPQIGSPKSLCSLQNLTQEGLQKGSPNRPEACDYRFTFVR